MVLIIRPTTADDWQRVRDLRLEALADTPLAFAEHLADALEVDEAGWRLRGARGAAVAIDDERWVGTMGGYVSPEGPLLVGVYVTPSHRGTSVAADLLATIETWARGQGDFLLLHVHEQNPRAIAFYRRNGFEPDGATVVAEQWENLVEFRMVR